MPAYKGTKELPKPSNKQARDMFTSMQKDREAMEKGRPDSVQRGEKGEVASMMKKAKGGSFRASANGIAKKGKTKAMMPKMACGGKMKGYAKGGSIDGIAQKGKTKGKMC